MVCIAMRDIGVHCNAGQWLRYKKAADWSLLADLVQDNPALSLIGNGDILTHYEAADRWQRAGFTSLMVGRGALIKPWIFQEIREVRACRTLVTAGLTGVRVLHPTEQHYAAVNGACREARHGCTASQDFRSFLMQARHSTTYTSSSCDLGTCRGI
jgi:tRNA-dihydrouridine synthase